MVIKIPEGFVEFSDKKFIRNLLLLKNGYIYTTVILHFKELVIHCVVGKAEKYWMCTFGEEEKVMFKTYRKMIKSAKNIDDYFIAQAYFEKLINKIKGSIIYSKKIKRRWKNGEKN